MKDLLDQWTEATAEAKYGVQRVFHDVFELVKEGSTTLIYGADYKNGSPCLVNTVGTMLTSGGGYGVPSANFGRIVGLFDSINRELYKLEVNEVDGVVSPLAAETFLRYFAPLKDAPEPGAIVNDIAYHEPSDDLMAREFTNLMRGDLPPCGEINYVTESESFDNLVLVKPESHAEVPD